MSQIERVPDKYFKYITGSDGIFEIRVEVNTDIYRVFCFFDKGDLIILINGFQKKTQKTPTREIELAEKLMKLPAAEQRGICLYYLTMDIFAF